MPRNFWMITSNEENFKITQSLGFASQGLKSQHRRKVQRVEVGDRVLFYVTGIRRFTATATVTASYEDDSESPWQKEGNTGWPYRIGIKPEFVLDESQYMLPTKTTANLPGRRKATPAGPTELASNRNSSWTNPSICRPDSWPTAWITCDAGPRRTGIWPSRATCICCPRTTSSS